MTTAHERYLEGLEAKAADVRNKDVLLWPRTPIDGDGIQAQIKRFVGVDDRDDPYHSESRPKRILDYVWSVYGMSAPSILDICCGDGAIIWHIKNDCPRSYTDIYGLDLNKGKFGLHELLLHMGVKLYRATIQDLFASEPPEPFDVAMMLNTYRGWESADLRPHERELPQMADRWLRKYTKRAILTAKPSQVQKWKKRGCAVTDLGRGEQESRLVVVEMKGG